MKYNRFKYQPLMAIIGLIITCLIFGVAVKSCMICVNIKKQEEKWK